MTYLSWIVIIGIVTIYTIALILAAAVVLTYDNWYSNKAFTQAGKRQKKQRDKLEKRRQASITKYHKWILDDEQHQDFKLSPTEEKP